MPDAHADKTQFGAGLAACGRNHKQQAESAASGVPAIVVPQLALVPVVEALNEVFRKANGQIKMQRQFVGNAAHQLRTPVTALTTYVEYAERINRNEALADVLRQISEATSRTVHLVNRLLSLARSDRSDRQAPTLVDLGGVVGSVSAKFVHQALRRRVDLSFDTPQEAVLVLADQRDLEELVGVSIVASPPADPALVLGSLSFLRSQLPIEPVCSF